MAFILVKNIQKRDRQFLASMHYFLMCSGADKCVLFVLFCFMETGSCYIAQNGHKLKNPPALDS